MKVSIITATYNSDKTILDTLESIKSQTYKNIETIIVDGLSKDNTLNIIKKNSVNKLISEKDDGIYDAMNKGISLSSGDIIGILNSDDIYYNENVIEDVVNVFKNKNCEAVFSDLFYVNKNDTNKKVRFWKTGRFRLNSFFSGWHPPHPTLFLKKSIYDKFGNFDTKYKLAADFELMLRLFEKEKIHVEYLEKPTVKMRLGGASNESLSNIIKQNLEIIDAFKKNKFKINSIIYVLKRMYNKVMQYKLVNENNF